MPHRSVLSRAALAAAATGIITAAVLPNTATAAAADSSLPLTSYGRMVVAGGHLFISGGPGSSTILVTDLDGNTVTTIPNESGAYGLAASPDGSTVYAALSGADAVSAISTTSLTETARYATTGVHPEFVAYAGGKVWFSYNPDANGAGLSSIGSVDPTASPAVVALKQTQDTWYDAPALAAPSGNGGILAAAEMGISPTDTAVYNVSASPVTTTVRKMVMNADNSGDIAVTPDGADLILASGSPYVHQILKTTDLSPDGSYPTAPYPDAVAVAPDGFVAAGLESGAHAVYVFAPHASVPVNTYDFGGGGVSSAPGGLAWAPDGSRLFVVSETLNGIGYSMSLHVLDTPEVPATQLTLTPASSSLTVGQSVTLTGKLTSAATLPAGAPVHVSRTMAGSTVPTPLPDVVTAADGSFTVTDIPPAGQFTYTASYSGDAGHGASSASAQVTDSKVASSMMLTGPWTATRGFELTLTGQLANAPYAAGAVVQVSRTDLADPSGTSLGTVPVNPDGSFTVTDAPQIGGADTYTASFAGDQTHDPSSARTTVQVSRAATALSITTDARNYAYAGWAKVTVHLGPTHNSRTVTLQAVDATGKVIANHSGTVDAQGNMVTWVHVSTRTTFTASFAGDYQYAPATAQTTSYVSAGVFQAQGGYYASAWYGKTLYRVYHHTTRPVLGAAIAPNKSGQCVFFALQEYYGGAWHAFPDSSCFRLNTNSAAAVSVNLGSSAIGHLFRIDSIYRSDSANLGAWGAWQYFTIRS